ncbi:MAG: nicotinate-nucleotide adenylyltransferase [Anaerovoracaceae bacterium]|jgi:nicotinate-nucleotide adenylyltransferase|nr:nicotinate-nucleotide adenylyltransferase [Anaerovoracaceae bacterium]
MMKIGIFGGTFDPVHNGHIALAKSAIEQVPFDKLIVVPARIQPFKVHQEVSSGEDRLNMLKLAFQDLPQAEISSYELEKKGISYTIDTMNHFKEEYPHDSVCFLMGTDTFLKILEWKNAEDLLRDYTFVIGGRPGYDENDLQDVANKVREKYGTHLVFLKNNLVKQESTSIRNRAGAKGNLGSSVPEKVEDYILGHGLYLNEDIREYIHQNYSEKRRLHTMGVEETALKLGEIYGGDKQKIRTAALFHDICRGMEKEQLNQYVKDLGLDGKYLDNPNLAHGKVGAELMIKDFDIKDNDVLNAVRYHTTGRKGMSLLEKIIYLADAIEPNRNYPGVEDLRKIAFLDLDKALLASLDQSISFIEEKGYYLDNDTVEAKNDIMEKMEKIEEDLNGK